MTVAAVALALAGLVAGLTGTWSPCGFSMIDTLGPHGHPGGRRRTAAACAAFAVGAPLGGAITFAGLAALGALAGSADAPVALAVAVAIAIAAAALDATGVRIAPQLRRQVPESWRRVLPLPLAGGLYGVLLGLGFTTYLLSWALPALAAVSVAVGDVGLGLGLGIAFGVGRALPIVVLAPLADTELGARAITAMAERPALLRRARAADAVALLAVAAALAGGEARAAAPELVARPGADPSVDGQLLALTIPGVGGELLTGGQRVPAGGTRPAVGGGRLAYVAPDGTVTVVDRAAGTTQLVPAAAGADALAVSARWLVWRVPNPDRLFAIDLVAPPEFARLVAAVPAPGSLSRPALDGDRVVWSHATRAGSEVRVLDLAVPGGAPLALRRERRVLIGDPSLRGGVLLYTRATALRQELVLAPAAPGRGGKVLLRLRGAAGRDGGRGKGHTGQGRRPEDRGGPVRPARYTLQSTALGDAFAYVTRLARAGGTSDVVRVAR
ncbi:hypothetical protein [Capillimicrobium parvum]|uniref:Cytochrome C biogenesis protein transmembrane domain-containing protein n=1 Tax=Capillimicrobium parvum TaxID=2884022 RepID=A0A9E7C317_9ACTN|nr:hypothetical protein [Capillimicrobium parvum]UGS38083.1 hypothetical protein DSM104329_04505 [Capillimicrobium parvum]